MNNASCKELLTGNKWILDKSDDFMGFSDDVLRRYIPGIRQEDLDKIVLFLKKWTDAKNYTNDSTAAVATVADPMVHHGKPRSGTWYGGRITYDWIMIDGVKTLCLFQVLYKGNVTVSSVETENSCAYDVETTYYFKAATLATLPASNPTLAISYERGGVSRDSDTGTYTYYIAKRTRLYQKVTEYTSRIDASETILSTHHTGVKSGDKDDSGADIGLNSLAAAIAGEIREQHRQKNADCSQDINEVRRQITDQQFDRSVVAANETLDEERHSAAAAPVTDPPVPAAGQVKEIENRPTPYKDKTETIQRTRVAIDQTQTIAEVRADEESAATIHTQKDTGSLPTTPPVPGAGEIKTVRIERTEFKDRARTTEETRTIKDQQFDRSIVAANETLDEERHSAAVAPVTDPPVPAAGEIKEIENRPTPYKDKTETILRTRTIKDQTATGSGTSDRKVVTAAEITTEEHHTAADAPVGDPTPAAGQVVEVINRPTQYTDKTETVKQIRAVQDQTATAAGTSDFFEDSAEETIDEIRHTAAAAAEADVTYSTAGTIVQTQNEPLPYKDRFATRKRTATAKYQSGTTSWPDRYGTSYLYWGKNATSAQLTTAISAATLSAATDNNISYTGNKYGLLDYVITKLAYGPGGGGAVGEATGTGKKKYVRETADIWSDTLNRKRRAYRILEITYSWTVEVTKSAALAAIDGGYTGSRYEQASGVFLAIKVTAIAPISGTDGQWTVDETRATGF